jgi:hypothetical protein
MVLEEGSVKVRLKLLFYKKQLIEETNRILDNLYGTWHINASQLEQTYISKLY